MRREEYKIFLERSNLFLSSLDDPPIKWTKEQICEWVSEIIGYQEYVHLLKKKKINGAKFIKILTSKNESKKIGINKIGHFRFLYQQMSKLYVELIGNDNNRMSLCNCAVIENNSGTDKTFSWNFEEIAFWLKALDMSKYIGCFKINSIRGDILVYLNESILQEIGIFAKGDVIRILNSIKTYLYPLYFKSLKRESKIKKKDILVVNKQHFQKLEVKKWNMFDVVEWIKSIGLGFYSDIIFKEKIDGVVLMQLNINDIKELGIITIGHQKMFLNGIKKLTDR